jgi:hypothetical protein
VRLRAVQELKDRYDGQSAWIVGKGPSLAYLTADHFTDPGPVLTINESILIVQELDIPNPLYSMQKDGCAWLPLADHCGPVCQVKPPMCYPKEEVTVILQDPGFSERCLPDHELKLWVDPTRELSFLEPAEMSVMMCIRLAMLMGCVIIHFVSCDSLVGDYRTIDVRTRLAYNTGDSGYYAYVVPRIRAEMEGFPHRIVTPGRRA